MNQARRKARIGLVVVKAAVDGAAYFLMRANSKWKDISLIGGHEKVRDSGDLSRTARRELWEEVPSVRTYSEFHLDPLTEILHYGPIVSRSKGDEVEYDVQFFLLRIESSPATFVEALGSRTRNIWISEYDLLHSEKYRISTWVQLLDRNLVNGLEGIGYSFVSDLRSFTHYFKTRDSSQLEFALK